MTSQTFFLLILVAVVASLIVALLGWLYSDWKKISKAAADTIAMPANLQRKRRVTRHKRTHDQLVRDVIRRAEVLGERLCSECAGRLPRRCQFTSGPEKYFFGGDFPSYRSAMLSGRVPPATSFAGRAPRPVTEWSDEELATWLHEHPGDDPPG